MADHDSRMVSDHIDKLKTLENGMSEVKGNMSLMQIRLNRVYSELFNGDDGITGLVPELRREMAMTAGAREEQTRQHQQNSVKLNVIMALAAIMTVIVMIVGLIVSVNLSKHSRLLPEKLFHSQSLEPVLSYLQQSHEYSGEVGNAHF